MFCAIIRVKELRPQPLLLKVERDQDAHQTNRGGTLLDQASLRLENGVERRLVFDIGHMANIVVLADASAALGAGLEYSRR